MSKVWPDGTGPIYKNPKNDRQERVNNFHYNSVTHPVEVGKCCTDTCEICAEKLCSPVICFVKSCISGAQCCAECMKQLKNSEDLKEEDIKEIKENPPDGINMERGGRKTRRRKRKRRRKSTKKKRGRKRTKKKRKRRRRSRR